MESQVSFTAEERAVLLARLRVPFADDDVQWRIGATSRDKKKGRIVPYADKRAYFDRLNQVLTPAGWMDDYSVNVCPFPRRKRGRDGTDVVIESGKLTVLCKLTFFGIGSHTGDGEAWADDENGMTRASSQAFRRACAEFGLGRYFYNFGELWVPLNQYGEMIEVPKLPAWALPPAGAKQATAPAMPNGAPAGKPANATTAAANGRATEQSTKPPTPPPPKNGGPKPPQCASSNQPTQNRNTAAAPPGRGYQQAPPNTQRPAAPAQGTSAPPIVLPAEVADLKLRARIADYHPLLGPTLYTNIVQGTTAAAKGGRLSRDLGGNLLHFLDMAAQFIDEVRGLAPKLPEAGFRSLLDRHGTPSLAAFSSLNTLKSFLEDLRAAVANHKESSVAAQGAAA
jgi:hypothetical protein